MSHKYENHQQLNLKGYAMDTSTMSGDRAVVIIVQHDQVLLIHRIKSDREYYVLPGGHVEAEETVESACIREVWEETGLRIHLKQHVTTFENNGRREHYFVGFTAMGGEPKLGGPERGRHSPEDSYELEWVDGSRLHEINLQPAQIVPVCRGCVEKYGTRSQEYLRN